MALIVEDGTGKSDAESYISVADATTYHAARGNAAWAALSATEQEQALRKAVDYMAAVYNARWAGTRVTTTQALAWPRGWVPNRDAPGMYRAGYAYYANNVVPAAVANACAELALRASADDLLADQGAQVKSESVGPISVVYADGARQSVAYKAIDGALAPYLKAGGALQVVRA